MTTEERLQRLERQLAHAKRSNRRVVLAGVGLLLGLFAVLARRNAIMVLMGIELILNSANINFIAFSRYAGMSLDGQAVATSSADLAAGRKDGPLVDLRFEVEAKMAVPPWVQGALQAEAHAQLKTSIVGDLMGGPRYEQLFRASGSVAVAGQEHPFTGSGLRIPVRRGACCC